MSPILEVIIGLLFIYSLLAILVTQLNTVISETFQIRAQNLYDAMVELLDDDDLRREIVTHPLINLVKPKESGSGGILHRLFNAIGGIFGRKADPVEGILQSVDYISPQIFTELLLDKLNVNVNYAVFTPIKNVIEGAPEGEGLKDLKVAAGRLLTGGKGFKEVRNLTNALPSSEFKNAMLDAIKDVVQVLSMNGIEPDDDINLLLGVQQLDNKLLKDALYTLIKTADNIGEARNNIEEWFNTQMGRASGSFKTNIRTISYILGFGIALVLNVDSLHLAQTLWENPTLRTSVAAAAQATDLAALEQRLAEAEAAQTDDQAGVEAVQDSLDALNTTLADLSNLDLPIGWDFNNDTDGARNISHLMPGADDWLVNVIAKFIGLFATAVATAQGAPFWFGILRQLSGGATS